MRLNGFLSCRLNSISYFAAWSVSVTTINEDNLADPVSRSSQCIVSIIFPFIVKAPPVFHLNLRFFALILPIGIFGFFAQALLTLGLQREKAGRGTLAVCECSRGRSSSLFRLCDHD